MKMAVAITAGKPIHVKVTIWNSNLRTLACKAIQGSQPAYLVLNKAFRSHDFLGDPQVVISNHTAVCVAGLGIETKMKEVIHA